MTQGINALIIQPVDEISVRYKLMELMSKNILVVTVNTTLPDFSPFCYIGNDFYVCGKIAANLLELVTGGVCKIGIVTGNFNAQSHYSRIRGFQEYSKNYPQMEIVEIVENKDDEFISFERTKQMLLDHPEIDALFLVAGGVNGACRALKTFPDHKKIKVVSFDTVPTTKELVKDETIFATISQQPREQGMLALKVLFNKFFNNEDPSGDKLYTHIEIKLKTNIDL